MNIVPFRKSHVANSQPHGKQAHYAVLLERAKFAEDATWSVFDGDTLIAISGVVPVPGGVGVWALFTSAVAPRHFIGLHRMAVRALGGLHEDGVQVFADIDPEYPEAKRWARMLGFRPHGQIVFEGRVLMRMVRCQ